MQGSQGGNQTPKGRPQEDPNGKSEGNANSKDPKKSWNKKAKEAKDQAAFDFAAFVSKTVDKAVAKSTKAAAKKRKTKESDDDLAAFDLRDFNYEDMENLKIASDEEGEISDEVSC